MTGGGCGRTALWIVWPEAPLRLAGSGFLICFFLGLKMDVAVFFRG